jgi:hypothetical protein
MNDPQARALSDSQNGVPDQARATDAYSFTSTAPEVLAGKSAQKSDSGPLALQSSSGSSAPDPSAVGARLERRPGQSDPRLLDGATSFSGMDEYEERQFRRASPYNLR